MRNRDARIAGALYLLSVVVGIFDLMYIPGRFVVTTDAAATAHNILANQTLFRVGMAADLVAGVVWLFVPRHVPAGAAVFRKRRQLRGSLFAGERHELSIGVLERATRRYGALLLAAAPL